jgi:hypothetical protein
MAVAAPNLAYLVFPWRDAGCQAEGAEPRLARTLGVLELVGRVGVLRIPFFYDMARVGLEKGALLAVLGALSIYYIWARYFAGGRHELSLCAPILGIPLPMAVAPVFAVFFGAIVLHSVPLAVAALVLGRFACPAEPQTSQERTLWPRSHSSTLST